MTVDATGAKAHGTALDHLFGESNAGLVLYALLALLAVLLLSTLYLYFRTGSLESEVEVWRGKHDLMTARMEFLRALFSTARSGDANLRSNWNFWKGDGTMENQMESWSTALAQLDDSLQRITASLQHGTVVRAHE
jgi:hypothetical protein